MIDWDTWFFYENDKVKKGGLAEFFTLNVKLLPKRCGTPICTKKDEEGTRIEKEKILMNGLVFGYTDYTVLGKD